MLLEKCYQLLGIDKGASEMEIKAAYRRKAKFYHPDINKHENAKAEFQILHEAYQYILKNHNIENQEVFDETAAKEAYKKYGRSIRNTRFNPDFNYQKMSYAKKDVVLNRSSYDVFIFWFFILLGINMLIFGIIDLIKSKDDEKINISGIIIAIPFLIILITGWNLIKKHKSNDNF